MDINQLLQGVDCSCGRHHSCDIQAVYIGPGAIANLTALCPERRQVLVVADENTFAAAGKQTMQALADRLVRQQIFNGGQILVPDERTIAAVQEKLPGQTLIVGIGSGVIQDLCKYVSHESGIPYIIVATAPSMDGYASTGAAMITGGMKVTYSAGLPTAILADTEVLRNAPMDMIRSGYGDIVGKFSSLNDWKLAHCINGEYFCPFIYDLTYAQVQKTLTLAEGLLQRREESVAALMEALVMAGILMSFAGSSRPASGSEHHLSHFFEITGIVGGKPYLPHGLDVAYATVITSRIRQALLSEDFPDKRFRLPRAKLEQTIHRVYTDVADGCLQLQDKVGNYAADRMSVYLEKEAQIKAILAEVPTPEQIQRLLALAELDIKEFYEIYTKEQIADAVTWAKDLKDRYTVLWIWYDLYGEETKNII